MSPSDPSSPAGDGHGATRRRRKDARPQELLDAALALFVEKGFAATRSEEVAARAGVSKGTLYLYYPSKEELFKAVVRRNLSELIAEGSAIADAFEGSAESLLRLLMHTWRERAAGAASGIHKVVIAEVRSFPELAQFYLDEVVLPAQRLIVGALQRGIDRGEFRPLEPVPHLLIAQTIFHSLCEHSLGACVSLPVTMDATLVDLQLDLLLHGLLRRPNRAGAAK
jgi:AcrR family transcriptional regulator